MLEIYNNMPSNYESKRVMI